MSGTFDRDMRRACEPFERDHDRLCAELMASLPTQAPEAQRLDAPSGRRLGTGLSPIKRRILRIGIPATAAAAVLLVVGLWPVDKNGHATDRVYALSDVPALMNSARTLHIKVLSYNPQGASPDGVRDIFATDWWVDQPNSRWARRGTYVGERPLPLGDPNRDYSWFDRVCDGQYEMWVDSRDKTVTYEKFTPFWSSYEMKHQRDLVTVPMTEELLDGCTYTGQELLDGQAYQVWERTLPPFGDGRLSKWKLWFSPRRGEVSQMQTWERSPRTNDQWAQTDTQYFERDVAPPPGTFLTEPLPGYRMTNTKETADPVTMRDHEPSRVGAWSLRLPVAYELPGRVVLLGWSCIEQDKQPVPQEDLFKDLTAGGSLPKLPLQIHGLLPCPRVETLSWTGFHLAHTVKNGRDFEWSLYVPNQSAPRGGISGFELELRPPDPKRGGVGRGTLLRINTAEDFDEFVLGAMTELSDTNTAPTGVTYDGVMQLSRQIGESLAKP